MALTTQLSKDQNKGNNVNDFPGVIRIENKSKQEIQETVFDLTHSVYKHEDVYGQYCTIQDYIDCPPEKVFNYLKNIHCLEEWTLSVRDFEKVSEGLPENLAKSPKNLEDDLYVGKDKIGDKTQIFCKVVSNPNAMTVDYHCAWDQGKKLWMIYLMRVIPAELVLNRAGSVVLWTNCRHPYYDQNPNPELSPPGRPWVGDFWPMFYAGHWVELQNLKKILEYRHSQGLPMGPLAGSPLRVSLNTLGNLRVSLDDETNRSADRSGQLAGSVDS